MLFGNLNRSRSKIDIKVVLGVSGALLFFMGLALLLPLPLSLIDGESIWWVYAGSAAVAFVLGGGLFWKYKPETDLRAREAFLVVSLTWILLSVFGALPLMLSGSLPHFSDAFFEAMSGLTTTGATVFGGTTSDGTVNGFITEQPRSILLWRSLLHWFGGMGFVVLSVAVLPFLSVGGGSQLFSAESSAGMTDKITPRVQEAATWLWVVYLTFTVANFVLLWAHPKMDWFDALNHAMATLATGGFSTKDASLAYYDSAYLDWITTIFMFLAGMSFTMHFRLLRGEFKVFGDNRETRFYSLMVLISVVFVSTILWAKGGYNILDALRYGAFQVVSIVTTTGFVTDNYEAWPSIAVLFLFLLFFTGGTAGSTAGGIKSFRILILLKNTMREIRQTVHPRGVLPVQIGPKNIEPATIMRVLSFVISYVFFFSVGALILTALGLDFMSAIGASISCLGNIGPALGEFGPINNYASMPWLGKWTMSFLMMIGRLEVFTVLVLFSKAYWRE
jgi:trk system potassium uptake protein TrkH